MFVPHPTEQSLYHFMETLGRRLTVDEAMFYWLQILDAVEYLHNLKVPLIHKDIKGRRKKKLIKSY